MRRIFKVATVQGHVRAEPWRMGLPDAGWKSFAAAKRLSRRLAAGRDDEGFLDSAMQAVIGALKQYRP
jgi:hypothetical protein